MSVNTEDLRPEAAARPRPPPIENGHLAGVLGTAGPRPQGLKLVCADSLGTSGESQSVHLF